LLPAPQKRVASTVAIMYQKSYDRISISSSVPSGKQICYFKQTAT